ncbi:hypothetical protein CPAR01_10452 [Colletotrichum paranaense]|uniref:Uncharacterized protein n=1 Tax=Colletotrichum paranaense TaxID=1914294 RepID=A0ABQ9SE11_9PEZI|nr:uncharacterized protein CPAR01_10452 [Colletotrichum paranaense]KAK1533744.1 hypothetical protein CPAR01_10452 [Colletotrichum paranaense]
MATERAVAVQLTEDWTLEKSSLAFLFHPSTQPFRELKKDTRAWLHISKKIDGHDGNEWAIITPLKSTSEGLVEMFPGDHSKVEIPYKFLRAGLRVIKDWGFNNGESDQARQVNPTKAFRKNDMLVCDELSTTLTGLIKVKVATLSAQHGFKAAPPLYTIQSSYVDYGYEKADNCVNNRHLGKRRASQMN